MNYSRQRFSECFHVKLFRQDPEIYIFMTFEGNVLEPYFSSSLTTQEVDLRPGFTYQSMGNQKASSSLESVVLHLIYESYMIYKWVKTKSLVKHCAISVWGYVKKLKRFFTHSTMYNSWWEIDNHRWYSLVYINFAPFFACRVIVQDDFKIPMYCVHLTSQNQVRRDLAGQQWQWLIFVFIGFMSV